MPLDDKMLDVLFAALQTVLKADGDPAEKVAKVDAYLVANEKAAADWDEFLNWWIDEIDEDDEEEDDAEDDGTASVGKTK